jgi:hypothetical protein
MGDLGGFGSNLFDKDRVQPSRTISSVLAVERVVAELAFSDARLRQRQRQRQRQVQIQTQSTEHRYRERQTDSDSDSD